MPLIHTYADIDQLRPLSEAEEKLLEHCKSGEPCMLENGELPSVDTPDRTVRADLLRYLMLGGCKDFRVNGWGVTLSGAYISSTLDLSFETTHKSTGLINCQFAEPITARETEFNMLVLSGSTLPGMNAQGAKLTGGAFLRSVTAMGEVSLSGAQIGGHLDCTGARLSATQGDALNAQRAKVTQGVFLRDVTATGGVSLSGAQIGGQLVCNGAKFSAKHGDALTLQRADIREGFFWRNVTCREGILNFTAAHVGDLVDDMTSWPEAGRLYLDGFTYDRISAAPIDAAPRLDWLAKGSTWNGEFFPQPYTQLAKVLREMGHDAEARKVLAAREGLLYQTKFKTRWRLNNGNVADGVDITNTHYLTILWSWMLRLTVGYGHHPFRSVIALFLLWLAAASCAHLAWEEGSFAPNSGPILLSDDWQQFAMSNPPMNPAALWSEKGQQGQDWESFNPHAYAADLVIPIVDIGQTAAWAPSNTRGFWGYHLWWLRWVFTLAGWIVTALGAAAITGIIRRD